MLVVYNENVNSLITFWVRLYISPCFPLCITLRLGCSQWVSYSCRRFVQIESTFYLNKLTIAFTCSNSGLGISLRVHKGGWAVELWKKHWKLTYLRSGAWANRSFLRINIGSAKRSFGPFEWGRQWRFRLDRVRQKAISVQNFPTNWIDLMAMSTQRRPSSIHEWTSSRGRHIDQQRKWRTPVSFVV